MGTGQQRGRHPRSTTPAPCSFCGRIQSHSTACRSSREAEATLWQETAYLWAYLHTRADQDDHELRRLRAKAQSLSLNWLAAPPAPMTFAERLGALQQRSRQQVA